MNTPVYLDYNATAPLRPDVRVAMTAALDGFGNPSSVHWFGRQAQARIEHARTQVAHLVAAAPAQVVFTSGGTEANNLAIFGTPAATLLISAVEHDSVLSAAPEANRLPVDGDGVVLVEPLETAVRAATGPVLVSVMLANNETGVIQPIETIAGVVHAHGGLLHCDAVQAAGKLPIDMDALGIDLLSLSAHKIGGPTGCGALIVSPDVDIVPALRGGGQERRRRAGTENVAGIVGFGVAAELAVNEADGRPHLANMQRRLEAAIRNVSSEAIIYGSAADRLPNTSCIGLPGVGGDVQVMNLDLAGIAVSAGAACSSGKVTPSHVLRAMGVGEEEAGSAIRISTGWATAEGDIGRFVDAWSAMATRLVSGAEAVAA